MTFQPPGHHPVRGILTRYNKKTVTVMADNGRQWNVAPGFLSNVEATPNAGTGPSNVIHLGKRLAGPGRSGGP